MKPKKSPFVDLHSNKCKDVWVKQKRENDVLKQMS